jgi:RHS repeat-associated protein
VSGSRALTAQSGWVGYPSSCTWTANGAGGTSTYTETMTTVAGANSSVTYIHTDGLGSPVARTDANGNVISRTRYEPYGYVASGVQPTIGFTGHVNDVDTGLTYMQQRYYDPVAGRMLSIDPVLTDVDTGGGFNRYGYANNSPYKYTDPDGRNAVAVGFVGGAAIVMVGAYKYATDPKARAVINRAIAAIMSSGSGPKPPKNIQPITNPPQPPVIPPDWESRPGRNGGTIYYPPGTEPADGEHIRVMPPGSTPTPGYEDGYWRHVNGNKQPIDPSTGKPGKGPGDTHIPLPPDYVPPERPARPTNPEKPPPESKE